MWKGFKAWLDGEGMAMFRAALNDVRGRFHEVAWGRPENPLGQGEPLNPTPQIVTGELLGRPYVRDMPDGPGRLTMADLKEEKSPDGKGHEFGRGMDRGMEM
jgi:hypothetical protein